MTAAFARLATALRDRYRIERELGQGGMATVYLAHASALTASSPRSRPPPICNTPTSSPAFLPVAWSFLSYDELEKQVLRAFGAQSLP